MSGAHLTVQNLTTGYHGFQVLQDLSLKAAPGITVIVGPTAQARPRCSRRWPGCCRARAPWRWTAATCLR